MDNSLETAIEKYHKAEYFDYSASSLKLSETPFDIVYLENCLSLLNQSYGKNLQSINVNGTIRSDSVNIYFIERDPERLFTAFKGNCAYTGYRNIIICDLSYVNEWQSLPNDERPIWQTLAGKRATAEDEEFGFAMVKALRMNFVLWILGHEIGHLAHGHLKHHYAFGAKGSEFTINNFDGRGSKEEQEADEFMVEAATGGVAEVFYLTLSDIITQYQNKYMEEQGLAPSFLNEDEKIILRATSSTHPPFFLRAINLFLLLNKKYVLERSSEPLHFERLKDHIVVMQ
jgi:hypothetical protein